MAFGFRLSGHKSILVKNAFFLYLLTLSSQLINVVLIPFETRVLGPAAYGVLSLAVSLSLILSVVLDFGFIVYATEQVVRASGNSRRLSRIFTDVTIAKIGLSICCALILAVAICTIEPLKSYPLVFWGYYLAYIFNSLIPDYLYFGLEEMKTVTLRTVVFRVLSAIPIFLFVRFDRDIWIVPVSLAFGNGLAFVYCIDNVRRHFNVAFDAPSVASALRMLKNSAPFFVSKFASTFYQSMNSVLLGYLYPGQPVVGQYGAADKFLSLTKQFSTPISDSLYPHMIRTKNMSLCKRCLLIALPFILIGGGLCFVFAEQLCLFVFGPGYEHSAILLRCLLPAMMVTLPTYIVCFPVLVPLGLSRYANQSNVFGAVIQIMLLLVLMLSGRLDAVGICLASSVSEVSVFAYRLFAALYYGRKKLAVL